MPQNGLSKNQHYFSSLIIPLVVVIFLRFQSSEKLDSDSFCYHICCLCGEMEFQTSLSCPFLSFGTLILYSMNYTFISQDQYHLYLFYSHYICQLVASEDQSTGKESACNAGDPSLIPRWGRSPGEGIGHTPPYSGASLVAQMVKNLLSLGETWVRSLGWEDPLEKGMVTHTSILAWRIPWTEEPGGPQSMGLQRVGHN